MYHHSKLTINVGVAVVNVVIAGYTAHLSYNHFTFYQLLTAYPAVLIVVGRFVIDIKLGDKPTIEFKFG